MFAQSSSSPSLLVLRSNTFRDNNAPDAGCALYIHSSVTDAEVFNNSFLVGFLPCDASMIAVQNTERWICAGGTYMSAPPFSMPAVSFSGCRFACPSGTFGSSTNLTQSECSGRCPAGHYCPEKTIRPIPCPAGTHLPANTSMNTSNGAEVIDVIGYSFSSCLPCAHPARHPPSGLMV